MFWRLRNRIRSLVADWKVIRGAVREHGKAAREASGKPITSQIAEIMALRRGRGRLAPDEYYQYCLFDDQRYTWEQKREFLGRQLEYDLWELFGSWRWHAIANDKLVTHGLFLSMQLPTPQLYALFHPVRVFGSLPALRDGASLAAFLRSKVSYPFIAKPVLGMWGKDIYSVKELDAATGELVLVNGSRIPVEEFAAQAATKSAGGYLFQELLQPHTSIEDLCGRRICSVRMVTVLDPEPKLISTLWKIAVGRSMADNYWEPGNLVAPVDASSGVVGEVITGLGLARRVVSDHPDTGRRLVGITLPDWEEAVDLCLRGTASLPGLRMQAWDVALTDRGPVLLEVNIIGGLRLPQLVVNAGLYRGALRALLIDHGYT